MVRILIIDDNAIKSKKISELLQTFGELHIESASDLVYARQLLQQSYDLLILDMNLPERFDETPKENNGFTFVNEIKKSSRLKQPTYIIGLTEYEEIIEKYNREFQTSGFVLVHFDYKAIDWQHTLQEMIKYIEKSKSTSIGSNDHDYDVAILTALRDPEFQSILDLDYNWERKSFTNDYSTYYIGKTTTTKEKKLKIVASYLPQMGLVSAAFSASKIINTYRPKYFIMTGICGGVKGSVSLGDIIICDSSFDLGSGKITFKDQKEWFEPDFKAIPLSGELKVALLEFCADRQIVRNIQDSWPGNRPQNESNIKIGPVGSGAAVIANSDHLNRIKAHQRKLLAIDMETYSIFYSSQFSNTPSPTPISIKAVCDFADHEKNDNIQKYCSHLSARTADLIIRNILRF